MRLVLSVIAVLAMVAGPVRADEETDLLFAEMLRRDVPRADLSAHVEIVNIVEVEARGLYTRYLIEAAVLERFVGAAPPRLAYYRWVEQRYDDPPIGRRFIVNLQKSPRDGQYYVPDNGFMLPADERLVALARRYAEGRLGAAVDVSPAGCAPGAYRQPEAGAFAVQVFCDDALATNIAVFLERMTAPLEGGYSLIHRYWQGEAWGRDVISFAWAVAGEALFVATATVDGRGSVWRLDLRARDAAVIWRSAAGDCLPRLVSAAEDRLVMRVASCDGAATREVIVPLP